MNLQELYLDHAPLFGGQIALIVMAVVFLILAVIYLVITLTGLFFRKKAPDHSAPAEKRISSDPVKQTPAASNDNEDELIAVLTAAVCAARAQNGETGAFRVVSFKRR